MDLSEKENEKMIKSFMIAIYSVPEQQHPIFARLWRFLSHNSSDTPGLAPLMNVSF